MKDLRCLVVDDEPLAADVVINYLQRLDIHSITRCGNGIDAFRHLQKETFDLLFLDIEMPQLSGFDLIKSLVKRPLIVITTAYRDFAVEGFESEVLDYLVKPFSFTRFLQTMEKALRTISGIDAPADEKGFIFLKADRQWIRTDLSTILYIESLKDYIRVVTTTGEYLCHQSLSDITATLPPDKFLRVHRSYTVALDKAEKIHQHSILIKGRTIPISRANRSDVYRRLGQ
jgi:DNA-binding LytR/AlgR family response regulator